MQAETGIEAGRGIPDVAIRGFSKIPLDAPYEEHASLDCAILTHRANSNLIVPLEGFVYYITYCVTKMG